MNFRNNKGITLVALIITIIIMLIIASITIYSGSNVIKEAQTEDVQTNMLLIQAKVKNYVEQAKFEQKDNINGIEIDGVALNITEAEVSGYYTINNMSELGLEDIDNSSYLITYDISSITVDVYYTPGVTDSEGNTYHALSEME